MKRLQQQNDGTELMVTPRDLAISGMGEYEAFDDGPAYGGSGAREGQVSLVRKVRMLLKGRYHWAVGLAAVGLLVGAGAGWFAGKTTYVSTGQVRVLPVLPRVMGQDDDRGVMQFFDSFVDSLVTVLRSQRVLDSAVQSEAWRATGKEAGPDAVEGLAKEMEVARARGSQVIEVSVTDRQPAVAQAGVRAVLESFKKISSEQDTENGEKVLEILQQEQNLRANELAAVRARILALAQEFGTDDLQKKYDFQLELLEKQEAVVRELETRLATVQQGPAATGTREVKDLTPEEIARHDPRMDKMLAERGEIASRLQVLRDEGVLENHRDMVRLRAELAAADRRIEARAAEYKKLVASGEGVPEVGAGAENAGPEVLKAQLERVKRLYEQNKADLLALGQKRLQIDALRQQESTIKDRLEAYKGRQEQLALQDKVAGRIQVMSFGDRPTAAKDTRIKYAAAGGFGGAALGLGLVILAGLMDRRFRSPEELKASMGGSPMLGVLPELPEDLSDPEQAALTAHFVHQIRTLLQIWDSSGSGTQVFSVTSPVSGTGKTSLTLALGVSFAAADSRTLLIDCDLVGGGLTSKANAIVKRKIGRVLQREGLLTDEQLEEAMRLASGSRRRLGEILVELGHLKAEELDSALVAQQKGSVGLLDAINGEALSECVAATGIQGLSVLPLGGARAQHASKVTPAALRRVLAEARKHYDTILIDTGPAPGSLEASVVAAEVDGVILCVSRGEQRPLAEQCVAHLQSVGARVAGVVFNRAETTDVSGVYGKSAPRGSVPAVGGVPARGTAAESARFGPMAQAVTYGSGGEAGEKHT